MRPLVDVGYYIQIGEAAYASLARPGDRALGDVFDEPADKFPAFVWTCSAKSVTAPP